MPGSIQGVPSPVSRLLDSIPMFHSLRMPNYRRWAGGALVSNIGTWMQRTAQAWLVQTGLSHHSARAVGIVMALQFAPQILLIALSGFTADRLDRGAGCCSSPRVCSACSHWRWACSRWATRRWSAGWRITWRRAGRSGWTRWEFGGRGLLAAVERRAADGFAGPGGKADDATHADTARETRQAAGASLIARVPPPRLRPPPPATAPRAARGAAPSAAAAGPCRDRPPAWCRASAPARRSARRPA